MKRKMVLFFAVFLIAGAALSHSAKAAGIEITPFAGYTGGGEFTASGDSGTGTTTSTTLKVDETSSYGIMVDINQPDGSQIELYYSRQPTRLKAQNDLFSGNPLFDLDIDYIHIGGTYGTATGKVKPFVVGTLGATYMSPKGEGLDSVTKFSLSLGGGVKLFFTDHVGLRLEGRWFGNFFDGSGSAFCSNGSCAIKVQGDVFSQFVANAGLILAF
jgi:opacity protein-like surface antigen